MKGDPSLWAEHGGLIGLVIFSLFGLVAWAFVALRKKDKASQEFVSSILKDEREERTLSRRENHESHQRLASALDNLAVRIAEDRHETRQFLEEVVFERRATRED